MSGKFSFKDVPLLQMEHEITGAVIDHADALRIAVKHLRVDDFRSEDADELRRIFYCVVGWYANGNWHSFTNRERLDSYGLENDHLWCPWGMIPEYVEALCDAITEANREDDAVLAAIRYRENNYPIQRTDRPATRQPERKTPSPKERRYYGGIQT